MYRLRVIVRFIIVLIAISLPFILLSVIFFEMKGIGIGFLAGSLLVTTIVFFSEHLVVGFFKGDKQEFKGLDRSLQAVVREVGGAVPRLLVFSDPSPDALALRSLGGRGTILLSQGLIGLVSEEELRVILKLCIVRLRQPGAVLQGLCSVIVGFALAIAPKLWVSLVFSGKALSRLEEYLLSPLSAMGFVILYPMIRFFLRLGNLSTFSTGHVESQDAYLAAMQKVVQAVQVLGVGRSQRAFSLFSLRS